LRFGGAGYLGLAALLACERPAARKTASADAGTSAPATDSLVLGDTTGVAVWFTLARTATGADGNKCVERGLEIRRGSRRVKVPLLYTGTPPVFLNDSTMRAILWIHCQPGDAYLVNLRTGYPVRDLGSNGS